VVPSLIGKILFTCMTRNPISTTKSPTRVRDWTKVPLLAIDSNHTKMVEDGIDVQEFRRNDVSWAASLKVALPLPLREGPETLGSDSAKVCIGISDHIAERGVDENQHGCGNKPKISLVLVRRVSHLSDSQANTILNGRENDVATLKGGRQIAPAAKEELTRGLNALKAVAMRISGKAGNNFKIEDVVAILMTHAQRAALRAISSFNNPPPIVVLRSQAFEQPSKSQVEVHTMPSHSSRTLITSKLTPTLLLPGEQLPQASDQLRLKERMNSGAINSTQLACALLGIKPLPEATVRLGIRSDSEQDRWKKGGNMEPQLQQAINSKRGEIREVLSQLSKTLY